MKKKICNVINIGLLSMMFVLCASCEDSYVDITYRLECPSNLLEYATPQVTYKGNDGNPITFTIPESAWEDMDSNDKIMMTIVVNGDTISKEGKMIQWKKHVHYDDFSIVDDEMTVEFTPKNSIFMESSCLTYSMPFLNGAINVKYEDGSEAIVPFAEHDTNVIISDGSGSLSDIISSHRNYKGFHVESNGTYYLK